MNINIPADVSTYSITINFQTQDVSNESVSDVSDDFEDGASDVPLSDIPSDMSWTDVAPKCHTDCINNKVDSDHHHPKCIVPTPEDVYITKIVNGKECRVGPPK